MNALPEVIRDEAQLEDMLSEPTEAAVRGMACEGDLLVLGVAGKMGPTLARMARRASDAAGVRRRIVGVSRFSTPGAEAALHAHGIETIRGELLDEALVASLPDAPNIIAMAGMKFGASAAPSLTWALNCYLPSLVCRRFPTSRIVAFSTGNVYPPVPVASGGSRETDPVGPVGEYAITVLGRERIYDHFSRTLGIPAAFIRLNYAVEMRYGVLVDVAQKVLAGEPIDLAMGQVNVIWQGDANAMTLAAMADAASPPLVLNVAGPEILSVRAVAEEFGRRFGVEPRFVGEESPTALLNNGAAGHARYGAPRVTPEEMIRWIAQWLRHGGSTLGKPTHYEVRDGKY